MPDAIAAATATTPAATPRTTDALAGMDGQGFLNLLVAQLRYQNPMSPSDPSALLQQTSALRQVESLNQVVSTQQQLVSMQQATLATGLVGRYVAAVDAEGLPVHGTVDAVRFSAAGPLLVIGDRQVPLDGTAEISAAPLAEATPTDL